MIRTPAKLRSTLLSPRLRSRLSSRRGPFALALVLGFCGCLGFASAAEVTPAVDAATVESPAEPITNKEIYGEGVRSTPWQTPAQERNGFHLPTGFEIRLFASEPQIAKPLNLAFDARGRLWVTQSSRYPYPHDDEPTGLKMAADAVMILEDADGDGYAERTTTFADGLNIPIGVLPYGDGCLCFSIPHIWYLRDTDGDGHCDRRERIVGPFDTSRDTHGMVNSLRDGSDGWIYACHGFNNQSTITGADGHSISLHSGNTFRFRPDGSRVEHVTHGQVNPFGMTIDDWGYRYSADCHSKPITQLIHGGCYPSFGRPHDGLGFLPPMVEHLHGSTAISGIAYVSRQSPLESLRGQMISGNVMTSRLNRNQISYHGATASGQALPDFLTSDDPWFRPVDIQLGPDGYLYVADFYNRIIGHYEVPLDHPGRDRTSGRIWQIRCVDPPDTPPAVSTPAAPDVIDDPLSALASSLASRRRLAVRTLMREDLSKTSLETLAAITVSSDHSAWVRGAAIEVLSTRASQSLSISDLLSDPEPAVRLSVVRASSESQLLPAHLRALLEDRNPHVVRLAAERLGTEGEAADIEPLLERLLAVDPRDPILRQTIRIAIAELLRKAPSESEVWSLAGSAPEAQAAALADVLGAVDRPESQTAICDFLSSSSEPTQFSELFQVVAARATGDQLVSCVEVARRIAGDDLAQQAKWLDLIWQSPNTRTHQVPPSVRQWAAEIADAKLNHMMAELDRVAPIIAWHTDEGASPSGRGWPIQSRQARDGTTLAVSSSFPLGESFTGKQRSEKFNAPAEIRFWIAGHNGFPSKPSHEKNCVHLVDAQSGTVLKRAFPPRSDVAVAVRWDTASMQGRPVRIECIDGDDGSAYAWLAIGGLQPERLNSFALFHSLEETLHWIERAGDKKLEERLIQTFRSPRLSSAIKLRIAHTLAGLKGNLDAKWLIDELAVHQTTAAKGRPKLFSLGFLIRLIDQKSEAIELAGQAVLLQMTLGEQERFALRWVRGAGSIDRLLAMGRAGWLAAEVFADDEVWQSLENRCNADQRDLAETLRQRAVANKTPVDEKLHRLQSSINSLTGDPSRGHRLYEQHCAACHQLRGRGEVVGPQLDGAAPRPLARLLEDILTPNRNVDHAFRTTSFVTTDGQVVVGLVQTETDTMVQIVDGQGKPQKLLQDDVEVRKVNDQSLMPSNFGELLNDQQLTDLLAHLRSDVQR